MKKLTKAQVRRDTIKRISIKKAKRPNKVTKPKANKKKTIARLLPAKQKVKQLKNKLKRALAVKKKNNQRTYLTRDYFETVLQRIPGSVYWKDLNGVYLGCNEHSAWMMGRTPAEIIGKTDYDFWSHKEADAFRKIDKQVAEIGKEVILEETGKLANGKKATYLSTKAPLRDDSGKVIGILGVSVDITKQKKLEEELIKSKKNAEYGKRITQRFLDTIIANLPCHVYWKDKTGVYLGCNDKQAKSVGLEKGTDVIGKTDFDLCWKNEAVLFRKNDIEVMDGGVPKVTEEPITLSDGTLLTVLSTKVPLKDEAGNITGILGISVDITERKKMEEELKIAKEKAEEANRAKSEFLSSMAHDLRTPMNGMYGMAQVLKRKLNNPAYDEDFDKITTAKKALERLIDDTLGYAKLEAGKLEMVSEPFNFRQLIQDVVMMLTHTANEKGLKLLVNYPDYIPRHVINDPHCLRRILMNLIGNAVKYTDQGQVSVNMECVKANEKTATLKLIIEDTGVGIPKDKLDFVFERFSRIEETKEKYQGTGLGLAIVKGMVERLGGKIHAESELGKGSKFIAELPCKLQQVTTRPSIWQRRYADIRVLVAGNNKSLCERILQNLGADNGNVVAGNEVLTTLAAAKQQGKTYQLVIMDDEIINVYDMARQIHGGDSAQNPMLVLLAKPGKLADVEAAQEAGFFGQLIKPVQPTELTDGVTRFWQKWQAQQSASIAEQLKQNTPKVLLVEDDAISSHFASVVLQGLSCEVENAGSGQEALEKLVNNYDVIFTDLGLPDMTGVELAKLIRQKEGSDYPTPIIAITGHVLEEDKQKCMAVGMNGFLGKPVEQSELEEMLAKWVLNVGVEKENSLLN